MMSFSRKLRLTGKQSVDLSSIDPDGTPGAKSKEEAIAVLAENTPRLSELQNRLYASKSHALLIVLQAMDAGGKDGTIRNVFSGLNPQGCTVTSFKVPSAEEALHDYLWRIHKAMPPRGMIGLFNRSHYEDVLAVRVHNLVPKAVWSQRYAQINDFEDYLTANGVVILKFFLHISKAEQLRRLEAREHDPEKIWKSSAADLTERNYWDKYMTAYDELLARCSQRVAPWHVIPANKNWYRNLAVSNIILETLEGLNLQYPVRVDTPER